MSADESQRFWGTQILEKADERRLDLGDQLAIFLKKVQNEIWIAHETPDSGFSKDQGVLLPPSGDEDTAAADTNPEQVDTQNEAADDTADEAKPEARKWNRWAFKASETILEVLPMMPASPLIVRPEYPFKLVPGATARFFTRIPLTVGLYDKADGMIKLLEIPSVVLSNTWFGDFENGELCFWLKTTARRNLEEVVFKPWLCTCPIFIQNTSDEELNIDKLCLRVERLSIFENEQGIWSDELDINYRGGDSFSDLRVSGLPPDDAKNAKLIGKPRNPARKGIAEKTFKVLNTIQSLKLHLG
ncbi:MAG: DUF432 domain-containing protein [Balneolales bacterium]|nr:DUF432 domain-containing protein [Balneolales bacterium]